MEHPAPKILQGLGTIASGPVGMAGYGAGLLASPPAPEADKWADQSGSPTIGQDSPRQMESFERTPGAPELDPGLGELAKPQLGGGGVGGGGFGGLRQNMLDAQDRFRLSLVNEGRLQEHLGRNKAERVLQVSGMQEALAKKQAEDAAEQRRIDEEASTRHQAFLARNEQLVDEIGKTKVDPSRFFKNASVGQQVAMSIGAVLGGMLQGYQGGSNKFLDRLDQYVDRDIQSQLNEIDNKKSQVSARNTLFGQLLQESGDRRLAAMQYRNLTYAAADKWIQARADALGTPEIYRNAQLASNQINQKLEGMNMQWATAAYQSAIASANAASAARRQAMKDQFEMDKSIADIKIRSYEANTKRLEAEGKGDKDREKEDNAAIGEATKRLAEKESAEARDLLQDFGTYVHGEGGKRSVKGLDDFRLATLKLKEGSPLGKLQGQDAVRAAYLSDDERRALQSWGRLGLIFRHKATGSGGAAEELADIEKKWNGAGTIAEKLHAYDLLVKWQKRQDAYANSVTNDRQRKELNRRLEREGISDLPEGTELK